MDNAAEVASAPSGRDQEGGLVPQESCDESAESPPTCMAPSRSGFPPAVWFIVVSEFCERYAFYGVRTVLAEFLVEELNTDHDGATAVVHMWISLCYASGGWIADSYWGKYKTIVVLSLVYCGGLACLAFAAGVPIARGMVTGAGLGAIGIGTGGIKPCVSAFGGDQFTEGNMRLLSTFFFMFYFSINVGSLLTNIITPVLRVHLGYTAAFSTQLLLFIVCVVVFISGRPMYRKAHDIAPRNVVAMFVGGNVRAGLNAIRHPASCAQRGYFSSLEGSYSSQDISDIRDVCRTLLVFIPFPVFWALFDQQASRWLFQARMMSGNVWGVVTVEPDQMSAVNSFLVLLFIPLFDRVIYPLSGYLIPFSGKISVRMRAVFKMAGGMTLCALSFLISAFVQIAVEENVGEVSLAWQLPQYIVLTSGEIMFSITALEFSYAEAPQTMKSVVMAMYLLTTALGNALTAFIAEGGFFSSRVAEFFFFAGLMLASMFVFIALVLIQGPRPTVNDGDETDQGAVAMHSLEPQSSPKPRESVSRHYGRLDDDFD